MTSTSMEVQGEKGIEASKSAIISQETVSAQDILIPKILLMQGLSDLVKEGEAVIGDYVCTGTKEKFGDYTSKFEVIPFYIYKKFIEYELIKTKKGIDKKFSQVIPIITDPTHKGFNDNLPLFEEDLERVRVFDMYCLMPNEIEADVAFPYVMPFQRTSMDAGRTAYTQMYIRNGQKGLSYVALEISAKSKTNEHGSFGVPGVKLSRKSTEKELEAALHWYKAVVGGETKTDDSDFNKPKKEDTEETVGDDLPY